MGVGMGRVHRRENMLGLTGNLENGRETLQCVILNHQIANIF